MPKDVSQADYEKEVLKSKVPVLVDFWGPQCRPCLALTPIVERLEKEYAGKIKVVKVNAGRNRMLCARLKIMSVPTIVLYKNGTEQFRLAGDNIDEKTLRQLIEGIALEEISNTK